MPTVILDPPPHELKALLERRRELGLDHHDEIWEGVLYMGPAPMRRHADVQAQIIRLLGPGADAAGLRAVTEFNLGESGDFRVPDAALLRPGPDALYLQTAALVAEVVSPGDKSWEKLPFYAAHGVEEPLIVDPLRESVDWLQLTGDRDYEPVGRSGLIELGPAELAALIQWPAAAAE